MAVGVEEEVQYCIDYFDFYDETTISENEVFETKDGDTKLQMDLEKEEE